MEVEDQAAAVDFIERFGRRSCDGWVLAYGMLHEPTGTILKQRQYPLIYEIGTRAGNSVART